MAEPRYAEDGTVRRARAGEEARVVGLPQVLSGILRYPQVGVALAGARPLRSSALGCAASTLRPFPRPTERFEAASPNSGPGAGVVPSARLCAAAGRAKHGWGRAAEPRRCCRVWVGGAALEAAAPGLSAGYRLGSFFLLGGARVSEREPLTAFSF